MSQVDAQSWQFALNYHHRYGQFYFVATCPHHAAPVESPVCVVPFTKLIRDLHINLQEIQAMLGQGQGSSQSTAIDNFEALRLAALPERLVGKSVLDIGGYDGYFAVECLARGARTAKLIDSGEWVDYEWAPPDHKPGVEYVTADFLTWQESADVVIFYNVLYHCPDPLGALKHVRALTREIALICCPVVWSEEPIWRLFDPADPGERSVHGKYTVYFKPSLPGLLRALRHVGFSKVTEIGIAGDHVILRCS